MKKLNLLVMLVAMGVIAWAVPATSALAVTHNAALTAQQEEEPAQATEAQAETQEFTGKIAQHNGKYVLHTDDNKAYQLDDQEKAKAFDGKRVKVTGSSDEQAMLIKVVEIEEIEEVEQ